MRSILALGLLTPIFFGALTYSARNYSGEVVTLYTTDSDGRDFQTQLWVIVEGDYIWLRSVSPTSPWLDRIINQPEVQLRRGPILKTYKATPLRHRREIINDRMAENYKWAEWLLAKVEGREESVPVYLDPFG